MFLDSLNNPLVSIEDQVIVEGADVDGDGNVIGRKYNLEDIPLSKIEVDLITQGAKKIILISTLNTTGAASKQNVRIRPQDDAQTIIGLKVGVNVDLDEELGGE